MKCPNCNSTNVMDRKSNIEHARFHRKNMKKLKVFRYICIDCWHEYNEEIKEAI